MGKADKFSKDFQAVVDKIGKSNVTKEIRNELSELQRDFQSYVDTHDGNFSEVSQTIQSVSDRIDGSNLTKSIRTDLQTAQRTFQSKIDKSRQKKIFDSETCFSKSIGKTLRAYKSESEADEAILYVKATYGNEEVLTHNSDTF